MGLETPERIRELQRKLYRKAKRGRLGDVVKMLKCFLCKEGDRGRSGSRIPGKEWLEVLQKANQVFRLANGLSSLYPNE